MGHLGKVIGNGRDLVASVLGKELRDPCPASTLADYAQGDLRIGRRSVHDLGFYDRHRRHGGNCCGDKRAASHGGCWVGLAIPMKMMVVFHDFQCSFYNQQVTTATGVDGPLVRRFS